MAQRLSVANAGKTQLKAEWSADITNRASTSGTCHRGEDAEGEDGIWCKDLGGYEDYPFPFGSVSKHHAQGLAGLGTENRLPLAPSVLDSDTASGTAPYSLESLTDVGRKTKVKNIQAIHEFPRKTIMLQYREERSQEIPKPEYLNGTRWIVLTKGY